MRDRPTPRGLQLLVLVLGLVFAGCTGQFRTSQLDAGVGQLTKADVLDRFGLPTERTQDGDLEVWTYVETFRYTIGSPYLVDPLDPSSGNNRAPSIEYSRVPDAPEGLGHTVRRRYRLYFDSRHVLTRWDQAQ